jgi:antitoxin VapB
MTETRALNDATTAGPPLLTALYSYCVYLEGSMTLSSVFTNNRSQAVRIPAELRLPDWVKKVDVRAKGNERIISPAGPTWDSFFWMAPK